MNPKFIQFLFIIYLVKSSSYELFEHGSLRLSAYIPNYITGELQEVKNCVFKSGFVMRLEESVSWAGDYLGPINRDNVICLNGLGYVDLVYNQLNSRMNPYFGRLRKSKLEEYKIVGIKEIKLMQGDKMEGEDIKEIGLEKSKESETKELKRGILNVKDVGDYTDIRDAKEITENDLDNVIDLTNYHEELGKLGTHFKNNVKLSGLFGPVMKMLESNFDHFSDCAKISWRMLFYKANEIAQTARSTRDQILAHKANIYTLFALHFLTDLFTGGHTIAPRIGLVDICGLSKGGAAVNKMHDEFNLIGLKVRNKLGETWTAFGDGKMYSPENSQNLKQIEYVSNLALSLLHFEMNIDEKVAMIDDLLPHWEKLASDNDNCPTYLPMGYVENGFEMIPDGPSTSVFKRLSLKPISDCNDWTMCYKINQKYCPYKYVTKCALLDHELKYLGEDVKMTSSIGKSFKTVLKYVFTKAPKTKRLLEQYSFTPIQDALEVKETAGFDQMSLYRMKHPCDDFLEVKTCPKSEELCHDLKVEINGVYYRCGWTGDVCKRTFLC
jgi:hypothetical protein